MLIIDTSQMNQLAVDLERAPAKVTLASSRAIRKTAYDTEASAKAFCPVDTGHLRASISTSATGLYAEVGPTAEYAEYVEDGTSKMAPRAYMGPAFDRHAGQLVTALEIIAGDIL